MVNNNNKKIFITFTFLSLLFFSCKIFFANASSVIGTIDSVYKYAKGAENPNLKIDMGLFKGTVNVVVTDSNITGFGWGENIGWVNFSPKDGGVINNGEGVLSGYATSELGGLINFKPGNGGVTINSSGDFLGYASSEKLGLISFNCINNNSCGTDNFKVKTDWRPVSIRNIMPPDEPPVDDLPIDPIDNPKQNQDSPITIGANDGNNTPKSPSDPKINQGDIINYVEETSTFIDSNQVDGTNISDVISNITTKTQEVSSFIKEKSVEIKKEAIIVSNTPAVDISTKTVTTAGVAGGSTAIVSSFAGSAFTFSEIFLNILRIWSLFLSAIGLRKKAKPWGTVYDSVTKQPIDPAYVVLQDKDNKEIATSITDFDGRFGFLVSQNAYKIYVRKNNYSFPSKKLFGKKEDELYDNLYFGEFLDLKNDELIIRNIPMDPEKFDWNEFTKKDKKLLKFSSPYAHLYAKISNILFYSGFVLALILVIINTFNYYNLAIIVLYLVLFLLKLFGVKIKSYGSIVEKETGFPLSFAIIRVFPKGSDKEIFHRVADKYGHYYCLLPKGEYHITIEKKNDDESYTKVYFSENFVSKKGILNRNFKV